MSGNNAAATAFYMRHTNPCGKYRITSQRRQCQNSLNFTDLKVQRARAHRFSLNSTATAPSNLDARCAAPEQRRCRLAVCVFGMLARYGANPETTASHSSDYDAFVTETIAFPSLMRHAVEANAGICAHDIFVHTWETGTRAALIERLYRPRRGEYGARADDARTGMFLSIERVLALRRAEEAARGVQYDWVLCSRFDAVWMAPLPLRRLSPKLWYVANWCVTTTAMMASAGAASTEGTAVGRHRGHHRGESSEHGAALAVGSLRTGRGRASCRPLTPFAPETHQRDGVPDYFFVAAPRSIDAVFDGLAEDLLSGRLRPRGTSCCNHAILATRLKDLGVWATLGRVLVHHMDIETLRSPKFEVDGRLACWRRLQASAPVSPERGAPPGMCSGDGDRDGLTGASPAAHWRWRGVATTTSLPIPPPPPIDYAQPAQLSRCPASRAYCLCHEDDWATHEALTQTAAVSATQQQQHRQMPPHEQRGGGGERAAQPKAAAQARRGG